MTGPTENEIIAAAMNEQGYLLQQKVLETVLESARSVPAKWSVDAAEVPVSIPNGSETRIDLILRRGASATGPWRVVVECKRAARDYKKWVFFGQLEWNRAPSVRNYYFEVAQLTSGWQVSDQPPPLTHTTTQCGADVNCPVFEYGLEARLNRPNREQRASATTAIEDAIQQVLLGQVGLMLRLRRTSETCFKMIPVVVTTAELRTVHFPAERISSNNGTLAPDDFNVKPCHWVAMNARINDSTFKYAENELNRNSDLAIDLATRQVRTVFIVEAHHLQGFLDWLNEFILCAKL